MADQKVNIKVSTTGAKKAKDQLGGVSGSVAKMGKAVGIASAAYFGARGLISGFSSVIKLAGIQEQAEKKLEIAFGRTSTALLDQASALQQITTFGDESIIGVQASIAAFVDSEEAIKKATVATLDIASAMGMDLQAAGDLVAKTLGSSANAMSRYGIEVTGAVGSTERLESLTNNVAELFGGQASAQAETMAGSLQQMNNAVGDAGEALGEVLAPLVISMAKAFKTASEVVGSFFSSLRPPDFDEIIEGLKGVNAQAELISQMETLKLTTELHDVNLKLREMGASQMDLNKILEEGKEINEGLAFAITSQAESLKMSNMRNAGLQQTKIKGYKEDAKELAIIQELIIKRDQLNNAIASVNKTQENSLGKTENVIAKMKEEGEAIKDLSIRRLQQADSIDFIATKEKMTDEERASTKAEFNQTMAEMYNSDFAIQRMLMSQASKRFEEAGVSDIQIAKFVAEQKKQIAINELNFKLGTVSNLSGALGQLNQTSKGSALVSKRLAQTTAIIDTYAGANKALAASPPPFNYIAASAVVAAGLANVATIESQKFADGGMVQGNPSQGDVNPAMLTAGEVILNQAQQDNLVGNMGGVTVNIQGNMIGNEEFVRDILIPEVQKVSRENLA